MGCCSQIRAHRGFKMCHTQPIWCSKCRRVGHLSAHCPLIMCYCCEGMGHRAAEGQEFLKCTICKGEEHFASRVRHPKEQQNLEEESGREKGLDTEVEMVEETLKEGKTEKKGVNFLRQTVHEEIGDGVEGKEGTANCSDMGVGWGRKTTPYRQQK